MLWTPFHLDPALMLGLLLFSHLDLPTLLVASIAPDMEPAMAIVLNLSYSEYGWFHAIPGSIVAVLVVTVVMYGLRNYTRRLLSVFRLRQESSFKKVFLASFLGVYSHILLDAPLHAMYDMRVPEIEQTPIGLTIYGFCALSFLVGLKLYSQRLRRTASP